MPKITAQAFDADCALAFFKTLDQIHLVAIAAAGGVRGSRNFGTDCEAAVAWAIEHNKNASIYWTVNRVRDGFHAKPGKSDIVSARFAHVDLDPPRDGTPFDKPAVIETLENLRHPPTLVIDSGNGLQGLWAIEDCFNGHAIERLNQQIRTMFGADACWNIDRLFRCPGSVNFPNAAKIARGRKPTMALIAMEHTGETYEMHELACFFPEPEMPVEAVQRVAATIGAVDLLTCDDLALTPFHPVRNAVERPKGTDRSQWVYHAACAMAREGYSDAQMAGLLLNPTNKVSAHLLDQGDPRRACERAIGAARGEEPEALPVVDTKGIISSDTLYEPERESAQNSDIDWMNGLSGPMRLMVDTVMAYAPSPRPELALGSAIALFATAMGRRYQTPSGLMTNIYIVGLSTSGSGKDLPVNAASQVLMATSDEAARMVGGSEVVSARGVMTAVEASPTLYIPLDEMGKLLQAMQDPRGHLKDAIAVLLKLYSQAQSTFKGAMYSNSKERPTTLIHRPCLGFYGVSNPHAFWDKLTRSSISDGLLPRFILLPDNCPDEPPPRRLKRAVWPDALHDAVKACMAGAEGHVTFPMGEGAAFGPKPYTVDYADNAADDHEYELRMRQYRMRQGCDADMVPFINRVAENAMKLALVRAVSDNPSRPVLRIADMEWGWAISERSVREFMAQAAGNISENEQEAKVKKVIAWLRERGAEGATLSQCGRRFQHMTGREREDILTDLEAQGLVIKTKSDTGGRPKIVYAISSDGA